MGGKETNTSEKGKESIQKDPFMKRETAAEVFRRHMHLWGISPPHAPGAEGGCARKSPGTPVKAASPLYL